MHRAQFTARMDDDKSINPCKGLGKVLYSLLARSLAENDAVVKVASTEREVDYVRISFSTQLNPVFGSELASLSDPEKLWNH